MTRVKSQERRVESRKARFALRSGSGSRLSTLGSGFPRRGIAPHVGEFLRNSHPRLGEARRRGGVTLIELLIAILIISILAGLILGVAAVAAETAREAHTRHMVTRLHTLLMEHYDSYKTRRVRLRDEVVNKINTLSASQRGRALAEARLYALRELMLMEIPDRWSDILLAGVPSSPTTAVTRYPVYLDVSNSANGRTALANTYLRRYWQAAATAPDGATLTENQGAECLYMVITIACGDGEARTLFHESDIGDTDGDGAPEFLDGWGRPINFLRWAPGFDSQIQINANELGDPIPSNSAWITAAANDHDPFDIFRSDAFAFRMVPLIFSGGRDETFSIRLVKPYVTWLGNTNITFPFNPSNPRKLLPYLKATDPDDGSTEYLGIDNGENASTDNIHNHLLGLR